MRTFLPLAFWYWLYNQLLFFLGALGFFVIHFLVAFIGFGGMDTLASAILTTLYAFILYKLFGHFLWRSRLQQYNPSSNTLICASLLPLILGSVVLTASFAIADGKIYNTRQNLQHHDCHACARSDQPQPVLSAARQKRLDYAYFRQHLQHLHHHLLLALLPQVSAAGNSLAEAVHNNSYLSGSLHYHYLQHNHYVSA